jgi:hypothetical protein
VDVTLTDVDQIDEQELAAVVGVQSEPQQPQLRRLQALAAKSQQLIALVDGSDKVRGASCMFMACRLQFDLVIERS